MTKFQLLVRYEVSPSNHGESWTEWTVEEAHSAKQAIQQAYLKKPDGKIVAVVAVPARSWRPQTIRTENVVKVRFGNAE